MGSLWSYPRSSQGSWSAGLAATTGSAGLFSKSAPDSAVYGHPSAAWLRHGYARLWRVIRDQLRRTWCRQTDPAPKHRLTMPTLPAATPAAKKDNSEPERNCGWWTSVQPMQAWVT